MALLIWPVAGEQKLVGGVVLLYHNFIQIPAGSW